MTATRPVAEAPTAFTAARTCQPLLRVRRQYRTIPACDSVNAVKTPITYRWMRLFVFAL